jgi:hypothetical protein
VLHDSALASAAGGRHFGNGSHPGRPVAAHGGLGEVEVQLKPRTMNRILSIAILVCCMSSKLMGSPESDLSSPSQEVRDAAAKIVRASYKPPSDTKVNLVVNAITNGMAKTNILRSLSSFKVKIDDGLGGGGTYNEFYHLDDAWLLVCWYRDDGDVLIHKTFSKGPRLLWVEPPANFTGTWVAYLANGQKGNEVHYTDGRYDGEFIIYNADGSKSSVRQFKQGVETGEEIGFYSSGRIKHRGFLKNGKKVGTWVWFGEDGLTNSIKEFTESP